MRLTTIALMLLATVASCSDPVVSQVMLIVDADDRVRAQSETFVVRVLGGREREDLRCEDCEDNDSAYDYYEEFADEEIPPQGLRIALAPRGDDWRRLYEASLTAYPLPNAGGEPIGTTRVISGYVRGETRVIRLFLEGSCLGVDCDDPDRTCRGGDCVDPFVPPDELDPFVPPDAAVDGGMDAAMCATGAECDDGVPCTFDDCVVGSCQNTPRDEMCADPSDPCLDAVCDASEGCTTTANTVACDDGNICNGTDQCRDGSCANIGPVLCPSPLSCESDGTCTGCTGGDCPGTQECVGGTCVCDALPAEVMETSCGDMVDNDCDGATDCADPNCAGVMAEVCDGATDEDCDLSIDEGCMELNCSNGTDDDMDTAIDCDDDDCTDRACMRAGTTGFCSALLPGCCAVARPETCGMPDWNCDGMPMTACDGGLGDGDIPEGGFDGGTDADFDAGFGDGRVCGPSEVCNNGIDDDCDDMVDCEDSICDMMPCDFGTGLCMGMVCIPSAGDSGLGETICDDMDDNDGDGFTDCVDSDCFGQSCLTVPLMNPGICSCTPSGDGGMCSPGTCVGSVSMDAGI